MRPLCIVSLPLIGCSITQGECPWHCLPDSRIKATLGSTNEEDILDEVTRTLHVHPLPVGPEISRALASACLFVQICIKYGARLLALTAPLTWSTEHRFYTFDIGEAIDMQAMLN